jgi:hypothetical protein
MKCGARKEVSAWGRAAPMIELIYCSRVAPDLEFPEIYKILKQSQTSNSAVNITGVLLFNTRYFLQAMEGPEQSIDALYQRIQNDRRHQDVTLIGRQPLKARQWSQWSMALVTPGISNQAILRKYCRSEEFNPIGMDASNARALLMELTQTSVQT